MRVNEAQISVTHYQEIEQLPWGRLGIDLVLECTGIYGEREDGQKHIEAGAGKVLFSQPARSDVDYTVVRGVNHTGLENSHRIVSNASCTTNCIVPVLHVLHTHFGVESGHITTLHSLMNDQPVIDAYHHTELRKTRSASQSMIPVDTALALGIERILPELAQRLSAKAIRVPTTNVSAMDLVVRLKKPVSEPAVNEVLQSACHAELAGVLSCTDEPLASCDFNHDRHSGIVDLAQTSVTGECHVKVFTWFDNEWGFANRMLEVSQQMLTDGVAATL